MLDESEIYVKEFANSLINLYKLCIEELGYDMGYTNNEIEYRNYLVNNPISISGSSYDDMYEQQDIDPQVESGESDNENTNAVDLSDNNEYNDIKIGSKAFPKGNGKRMDPYSLYYPFYTFGFGASPKKKPSKAYSQRTGIECCKLAIKTILGYKNKGCKTIGDVICMYHGGKSTLEEFYKYYHSVPGIKDIADGRFVSSAEMIKRQEYYQKHLIDYTHLPNTTPLVQKYGVLYPLITFISRQEQGVNCEEACDLALKEMKIT